MTAKSELLFLMFFFLLQIFMLSNWSSYITRVLESLLG